MAVAVWSSGWWGQILEMLQAWAALDGPQERRLILVDTEHHVCPPEVIQAAQQAFREVHVYRSEFTLPNGGTSPRTIVGLAGFINERLRHAAATFYMLPMIPSAPGSLDALEFQHLEGVRSGRKILGQIVGVGDDRQPYGSFVAHREWIYDPQFPLAAGIGMNADSMQAMKYMRIEMLRSFRATPSLLAVAGLHPDRNTLLKAFDLAKVDRMAPLYGAPAQIPAAMPPAALLDELVAQATAPLPEDQPQAEPVPFQRPSWPPVDAPPPPSAPVPLMAAPVAAPLPGFPDDESVKRRVLSEGMLWIGMEGHCEALVARAIDNPGLMTTIGSLHAAWMKAQENPLANAELATHSTPPAVEKPKKPAKAKAKKPALAPRVL